MGVGLGMGMGFILEGRGWLVWAPPWPQWVRSTVAVSTVVECVYTHTHSHSLRALYIPP